MHHGFHRSAVKLQGTSIPGNAHRPVARAAPAHHNNPGGHEPIRRKPEIPGGFHAVKQVEQPRALIALKGAFDVRKVGIVHRSFIAPMHTPT
jgi:hypothetical protein